MRILLVLRATPQFFFAKSLLQCVSKMKCLQGVCRKVSLPLLGVAAVGWILFVVGFGGFNNGDNFYNDIRKGNGLQVGEVTITFPDETRDEDFPAQRADADYIPYWLYVTAFPVMLVVVVLHLILHNLYIFGVIGHMLLGVCVISGSGVLWGDGRLLFSKDDNLHDTFSAVFPDLFPEDWRTDTYYGLWLVIEWVGVFLCLLAMVAYMSLLPFHTTTASCNTQNEEGGEEEGEEMEEK